MIETLQSAFLQTLVSEKVPVAIFLVSGVKLRGVIESFDEKVIRLKDEKGEQIIYKQSVSTVMPESYSKGLEGL